MIYGYSPKDSSDPNTIKDEKSKPLSSPGQETGGVSSIPPLGEESEQASSNTN